MMARKVTLVLLCDVHRKRNVAFGGGWLCLLEIRWSQTLKIQERTP
jgi:hypothetical protein